jgi:nicotinate-nucleotide adenylyltransferase
MKIGLFFGSFNPVHNGHLIIASHICNETNLKKIWFIVSPQNPFKKSETLLNFYHRLHLVKTAINNDDRLEAKDIEVGLPKPSYTATTLAYLNEKFPDKEFSIIIGSDSYQNIYKWNNSDFILNNYRIIVYMRPGFEVDTNNNSNVLQMNAPILEISATHIRKLIQQRKSIRYLVPELVENEIVNNRYYQD